MGTQNLSYRAAVDRKAGAPQKPIGSEVPLAYTPSGKSGQVATLVLFGALGLLVGAAASGLLVGLSVLVNVIHNMLPKFFFILPIGILLMLAAAPAALGAGVGWTVGKGVRFAECRNAGVAGGIAVLWTIVGCIAVHLLATNLVPVGESWLGDHVLPFVRLMVGGSIQFSWLSAPEPANVPAGLIYSVLGLSALFGIMAAFGSADQKVRSAPFCERCANYAQSTSLGSTDPENAERAVRAFSSLNQSAIQHLPRSRSVRNRVTFDIWACGCKACSVLELVLRLQEEPSPNGGEPKDRDPIRLYSRAVTPAKLKHLRQSLR